MRRDHLRQHWRLISFTSSMRHITAGSSLQKARSKQRPRPRGAHTLQRPRPEGLTLYRDQGLEGDWRPRPRGAHILWRPRPRGAYFLQKQVPQKGQSHLTLPCRYSPCKTSLAVFSMVPGMNTCPARRNRD